MKTTKELLREWANLIEAAAEIPTVDSSKFNPNLTFQQLRRQTQLMMNQWRAARRVFHNAETGIDITLSATSVSKSTSSAGPDLLKLHSILPEILEQGVLLKEEPPRDKTEPSLISVLYFKANVVLDGNQRSVIAIVKKQNSGQTLHYSLHDMVEE